MASLSLDVRLQVSTTMALNTAHTRASDLMVANHALLTMGGRIYHFEGGIGDDGILDIHHTFESIDNREPSYHNQMGWVGEVTKGMRKAGVRYNDPEDTKIKSHAILWLYRTYSEQTRKAGKGGQVKRCVLLGSIPINLADLMEYTVRTHEDESFIKVLTTITCKHNFCEVRARRPPSNEMKICEVGDRRLMTPPKRRQPSVRAPS